MLGLRKWRCCCILGLASFGPGLALAAGDRAAGLDHYVNREFGLAVAAFERHLANEQDSPEAHLLLTKALLYQELDRLGFVGTRAFRGDRKYRSAEKPKPDARINLRILDALEKGQQACERVLAESGDDREALHSLAQLYLVQATHQYFVAKAYFKALASGRQARELSYRIGELYPDFPDGLLVAGFQEYIVGKLPWALRVMIAMRGYGGNKKKGIQLVERVAQEGVENRAEARILLAVIYRWERPPEEAAAAFARLAEDFPRAYMFPLEAADLYESARQRALALELFGEVSRKQKSGENRFDRMSERMAGALGRRIEALQRALSDKRQRTGR